MLDDPGFRLPMPAPGYMIASCPENAGVINLTPKMSARLMMVSI